MSRVHAPVGVVRYYTSASDGLICTDPEDEHYGQHLLVAAIPKHPTSPLCHPICVAARKRIPVSVLEGYMKLPENERRPADGLCSCGKCWTPH
jgi:hypothetical protein